MVLEDSDMEIVFEIEVAVSRSIHFCFHFVVLVVQSVLTERNYCVSHN